MKKFLALITITLFVFVGCTAEEATPVVEEDTTTPDVVVEDITPVLEGVEFNSNEERMKALDEKAADDLAVDIQLGEDQIRLEELVGDRELTPEDCEVILNPTYKADCLDEFDF